MSPLLCYHNAVCNVFYNFLISPKRILNDDLSHGYVCTKRRKEEEEEDEERGEGRSQGGRERRKSCEWHHNITMHSEARSANTAGPATVKRLMSHNSKETVRL